MTSTITALIAGVLLAGVLVAIANRAHARWRRPYAVGLVVAALVYVVFALLGDAPGRWLVLEGSGVVLFGGAAWLGARRLPLILAVGWALHVLWDVLLHLQGPGAAYTPDWYPWLCVSFDLVIAAAVLVFLRRPPLKTNSETLG